MRTIKTNTGMLQLVDVGMYHGICSPDNLIDDWMLQQKYEEGYFKEVGLEDVEDYWFKFDHNKYNEWILKHAKLFIENDVLPEIKQLNLGILDIEVDKIWSPREYNFDTDRLIFSLVVEDEFEENLLEDLCTLSEEEGAEFSKYLKDNFTSVSGFISFIPNTVEGILDSIAEGDERAISAALQWLFYNRLNIFNAPWGNDHMDQWYSYIQEVECPYYSFLNIKN